MTPECLDLLEQLPALRADALPAAQAGRLRDHLAGCATCRDAWSTDVALDLALDAHLGPTEAAPGGDARLVAAIEALGAAPTRPSTRRTLPWGWGLAVAVGLLVAATGDLRRPSDPAPLPRDAWRFRQELPPKERPQEVAPDPREAPRLNDASRDLRRGI